MNIPKIEIHRKILDNGLTLLLNEEHKLPICTVMIWLRVGARNESAGITGVSHYLEHCYSMGTKRFGPRENSWLIQRIGGTKNAFTSHDYTAYYSNIPSAHFETVMDMEADRFINLSPPEENVRSEKEVIKEEKRLRYEDSPFGKMYETMWGLAYERHPYKNTVIGSWDDLNTMTHHDLIAYYKKWYVPENVIVVVSGDVNRTRAVETTEKYFGKIPRGNLTPQELTAEPPQDEERRKVVQKEAELTSILIAYKAVSMDHEDYIPLVFLSHILSAGQSSRLYQTLVYRAQAATFASSSFEGSRDPGLFQIMAQAQPGHTIEDIEKLLMDEIADVQRRPVSDREYERVKNMVESGFIHALETNENRAEMLGRYEVVSGKYGSDYVNVSLKLIEKTTKEDIRRVAQTYLVAQNKNTVILDPIKRN